jgi:surface antigen
MSKRFKVILTIFVVIVIGYISFSLIKKININPKHQVGEILDSLNGVKVFYNGGVSHTGNRNLSSDGYNIGLKYQCVEFVKRYYYEYYNHKMPDSYGNAKDFYDKSLNDREYNSKRDLVQYSNPSKSKPCIGDLIIFDGHFGNKYGHVAIISMVSNEKIQIIQQNPGPFASSREDFQLDSNSNGFQVSDEKILGWLRIRKKSLN